jgi:peptide/nickel transport system substrate-binding protein
MTDSYRRQIDKLHDDVRRGRLSRRDFMIRSAAIAAAGALPVLPFGARAEEPASGGFLKLGLHNASQNDSLDPGTWSTSWTGASFNGGVFNNLVEILPDGSVAGDLAESWELDSGAKTWRFKLRPGVVFHNGKSLAAEDVRQSLMHHMKPDSTSGARAIVQQIEAIDVDGSDTVVITLTEGNADLAYLLSDYHLSIYPALDGGGIDMESGVGTGAFLLESFEPGIATRLKRNPNYHKNGKPYLDEIEFINIPDATARLNALLTGEVDFIQDLDIRNVPLLERSGDFAIVRTPSLRHFTFDMDTRVAPFDNPDVRLALKYALDRQDVIDKVFLGEGALGNDNPVAPIQKYHRDLPAREFSIAKAKEHLAKAGVDTLQIDLSVAENAFAGAIEAATLYQEHAAQAGININVVREAADGYWENVWRKKPFCAVDYFGRATVDWLFATSYVTGAPWNSGWSNAEFDALHKAARAETDEEKRGADYGQMQEILRDDGNVITVAFVSWRDAVSNRVGYGEVGGLMPLDNMRLCERWWLKT